MANVRRHGGNCCAMSHIWGVGNLYQNDPDPRVNEARFLEKFKELREDCNRAFKNNRRRGWFRRGKGAHLIEIVTAARENDPQGQTEQLKPVLEQLGFREVTSVKNGNTLNVCTIFHLHMTEPFPT